MLKRKGFYVMGRKENYKILHNAEENENLKAFF